MPEKETLMARFAQMQNEMRPTENHHIVNRLERITMPPKTETKTPDYSAERQRVSDILDIAGIELPEHVKAAIAEGQDKGEFAIAQAKEYQKQLNEFKQAAPAANAAVIQSVAAAPEAKDEVVEEDKTEQIEKAISAILPKKRK
jgi:hypothetical protein